MKSPILAIAGVGVAITAVSVLNAAGGADCRRATLQERRQVQIERLRTYAERAKFPRNQTNFKRTPVFVDRKGTPCAVAYLMQQDGHDALVDAVAATNNTIKVMDIDSGPVLDWIRNSGLTQEECAYIQPSYSRERDQRLELLIYAVIDAEIGAHLMRVAEILEKSTPQSLEIALGRV